VRCATVSIARRTVARAQCHPRIHEDNIVNSTPRSAFVSPSVGFAGFPALLLDRGLITASDLAVAQSRVARDRIELADAVIALGVPEGDSYAALAVAVGADLIALNDVTPSEFAVRLVPERLARRHSAVALAVDDRLLTYGTCRPFNAEAESDLAFASGRRTTIKVATRSAVSAALDVCYPKTTLTALPRPAAGTARGSTATSPGRSAASPIIDLGAQPRRVGRIRVLVTDDEPITRMLVKVLLERERYEVLEAADGQQAIEMAMREHPDLLLIDLNMPVLNGYDAIGALRREFTASALPIIVLTADDGDSIQRRVLELGADDYLIKPFEPAVLMSRVNSVIGRRRIVAA
jgi:CheY-like chemotaxis protein